MADYISREAAIAELRKAADCANCDVGAGGLCGFCDIENAARLINGIPAADVELVRRIQWTPYVDGQTDTSGFATDDDYLLRTSTGYIVPGYWDDHFKEWTVPIEYDAAKDWADKFGQIVGFMKIQRPEDPA